MLLHHPPIQALHQMLRARFGWFGWSGWHIAACSQWSLHLSLRGISASCLKRGTIHDHGGCWLCHTATSEKEMCPGIVDVFASARPYQDKRPKRVHDVLCVPMWMDNKRHWALGCSAGLGDKQTRAEGPGFLGKALAQLQTLREGWRRVGSYRRPRRQEQDLKRCEYLL
jgi:hypothetical protein